MMAKKPSRNVSDGIGIVTENLEDHCEKEHFQTYKDAHTIISSTRVSKRFDPS